MSLEHLINTLILNSNQNVFIKGVSKKIIGFAEYKTVNLGSDGYFKIIFDDHSFLFMVPHQNLVLYTEKSPQPYTEITDSEIGNKKELSFEGRKYILDNPHDYQYVIRLIKGDYTTIEGEVKFSDYVPEDGSNELLSLGWIVRTGERADVNPKEISIEDIEVK